MSLKQCPIAFLCQHFDTGDSKPKNNDVRDKVPCKLFLDVSCDLSIRIQLDAMGLTPACKVRRIK